MMPFSIKQSTTKNILILAILITVALFVTDLVLFGAGISGDTAEYLCLAGDVYKGEFPFSSSYLPAFPVVVGLTAKLIGIKIYLAASIWIGLFYLINLIYIVKITHYLNKIGKINAIGTYYLFFILISWWSFRIQKATHADAMYFSQLIVLTYYLIKSFQENKSKYFLIIGFVLALMTVTKYNSYVLLPILGLIIIVSNIGFRKKIIFLLLSILPSILMILIWKILNRGFIYALKLNNYDQSKNANPEILETFYINISDAGKGLFDVMVNPVLGRYLNTDLCFLVGFSLVLFLLLALYKYRKSNFEMMFLLFATIYLISVIAIQSLNLVREINIRTLVTFNFFIFLLFGVYILKSKMKLLGGILFVLLFSNNVLMERKWLTQTSKTSSFECEYKIKKQSDVTNKSFVKSIENKQVISNIADFLMFHLNYQMHIKRFNSTKVFRKGKFQNVTPEIRKQVSEKLIVFLENGGLVVFSNVMSTNDKIIYNDLLANNYYSKNFNDLILIRKRF